jgi:hypothetical protein
MQAEKQRELEKQKEALRKSAERVQEKYIKTANAQEKEEGEEDGKSNEDKKEERE